MAKLLIVRHGESFANQKQIIQGKGYDTGLTQRGVNQSRLLAQKILTFLNQERLSLQSIFTSELKRSIQTAELIQKFLQDKGHSKIKIIRIIQEPLLNERFLGDLEGKSKSEAEKLLPEEIKKMYAEPDDWPTVTPGGGETQEQVAKRIQRFVAKLKIPEGEALLVVGHFGPIQHLVGEVKGLTMQERFLLRPTHRDLIILEY